VEVALSKGETFRRDFSGNARRMAVGSTTKHPNVNTPTVNTTAEATIQESKTLPDVKTSDATIQNEAITLPETNTPGRTQTISTETT